MESVLQMDYWQFGVYYNADTNHDDDGLRMCKEQCMWRSKEGTGLSGPLNLTSACQHATGTRDGSAASGSSDNASNRVLAWPPVGEKAPVLRPPGRSSGLLVAPASQRDQTMPEVKLPGVNFFFPSLS